ncbi:hypothetical protein DCO45_12275 [Comamonas sp. JNW]|nr:hypothetical protein DCO45_12275 [Comamonas sp. JNW]
MEIRSLPGTGGCWRCAGVSKAWACSACHWVCHSRQLSAIPMRAKAGALLLPSTTLTGFSICAQRRRSSPPSHWLTHSSIAAPVSLAPGLATSSGSLSEPSTLQVLLRRGSSAACRLWASALIALATCTANAHSGLAGCRPWLSSQSSAPKPLAGVPTSSMSAALCGPFLTARVISAVRIGVKSICRSERRSTRGPTLGVDNCSQAVWLRCHWPRNSAAAVLAAAAGPAQKLASAWSCALAAWVNAAARAGRCWPYRLCSAWAAV